MSGLLPDVEIPRIIEHVSEEDTPQEYLVEGKKATSYEWNVAQALDTVGLEYIFQMSYFGGRQLRGGIVLDFLVFTAPLATPLWVHGEYWHMGKQRTIDEMQRATMFLFMAGEATMGQVIWGEECKTPEDALVAVKRLFRIGA